MIYNNIIAEIEAELQVAINGKEFITNEYFNDDIVTRLKQIKDCGCGKTYLNTYQFKSMILDILLSYKEREDIMIAVSSIFTQSFINTNAAFKQQLKM